jgi:hypothetical protein
MSVKDQCTFSLPLLLPTPSLFLSFLWGSALLVGHGTDEKYSWGIVGVKGFDSTIGYTQWANIPAECDAAVRLYSCPLPSHNPCALFPPPIGRRDATRGGCRHLHQDERAADAVRVRVLQPPLGPYV